MDISKEQLEKFKKSLATEYKVKEGDRVYISDFTSLKKRQVDLYFKNNFNDVKRVIKLEEANVVFDRNEYNGSSMLRHGTYYMMEINGSKKIVQHEYSERINFFLYCKTILSENQMKNNAFRYNYRKRYEEINASSNYWEVDVNKGWFNKNYPELYQERNGLILLNDLDYSNILKDLDNIPIYNYTFLEKDVVNYLDDNVRQSFDEIDFSSIEMLLTSNDENNLKLGITLMTNYDMREYFSELVCVLFKTNCNTELKKFLNRYPVFKQLPLPKSTSRQSNLGDMGFLSFKNCIKGLKDKGYSINYDYIHKFLLDGI